MTQATLDLIRELFGVICPCCGRAKNPGHSFCGACYRILPQEMQRALYRKVGNGYEEAYAAAVRYLEL